MLTTLLGAEPRRTRIIDSLKDLNLIEQIAAEPPLFRLPPLIRAHFRSAEQPRQAWLAASACANTLQRQKTGGPATLSGVHASGRILLPHVLACYERVGGLAGYEASRREPRRVDFFELGGVCAALGCVVEGIGFLEVALGGGEDAGTFGGGVESVTWLWLRGRFRVVSWFRGSRC